MAELRRYVPGAAMSWPGADATQPVPLHRHVDGTLVFVDVSGFTALSEKLAQRGKVGAEQLTDVLNTVFGTMLGLAAARGGTLLKFGGDALFLLFTGSGHAVQATNAAVEMRSALAQTAKNPSPAGRLRLRMSVGVHTGLVDLFMVGTSHRELVVVGPATTAVAELEGAASAGQILLGKQTAAALPIGAVGVSLGPGRLLRWRHPHEDYPEGHRRPDLEGDVGRFVPTALRSFLASGDPESEHRTVGVSFVRYNGMDALLEDHGHQAAADALHTMVTAAQDCCDAEGVTFLATDLAEDGGKIIMVAGFPTTAEDDQGRLLRASRRIITDSLAHKWPLKVRVGLNRGHVFAGAIGSFERATVTVMGDTVNLAARVMAKAEPGQVLATPSTLDNAQRLFSTEPVEPFMVKGKSRPVTAYVVGDETGTRPPRGLGSLPFLGRDAELASIVGAIDALEGGTGDVITLVGETGIGKTRLLREALSARDRVPSVRARAEPYGAATPYRPLREPLRRLLGVTTADADKLTTWLAETVPVLVPDLAQWLPLIGDVLAIEVPESDATRDLDPQFRPDRTADAIARLIEALAGGPMILSLDDAHYADDATSGLMSRLETGTSSRPWLIITSRRDETRGYQPSAGTTVHLGPLTTEATLALVQEGTVAAPLRPHDVSAVVSRVAGNPLFLEETLRNLREHGDLEALPSSLEGMVAAQIDSLSPFARQVVRRASVLGRSFRIAVLNDLFTGEDARLDEATQKELTEVLEADGRGRLRFRHALLRDAAYNGLPFQRRRQLHHAAAESTLRRAGTRTEAWADNLALHFSAAGDHAEAWHWAREAAHQAERAYANPEAAVLYQRALEAARRLPDIATDDLVRTWQALGEARLRSGRLEDAIDAFRQAASAATTDTLRAILLTRIAAAADTAGRYTSAHRALTRAERLARGSDTDGPTIVARAQAGRAVLLLAQNRYEEAHRQAVQAIATARQCGDTDSLARSLNVQAVVEMMLGEGDPATPWREALAIRESRRDLAEQAGITGNLGAHAWFEGDWDEARRLYETSIEGATRVGDVVFAAQGQANLGELLSAQGRFDEAAAVLQQAVSTLNAVGNREGSLFAECQLARTSALRGDLDAARTMTRALLADALALWPTVAVDAVNGLAEAEVDAGHPATALSLLDEVVERAGSAGVYLAAAERVRGRALARLRRLDDAEAVLSRARSEATSSRLGYELALLGLANQELREARGLSRDEAAVSAAVAALRRLGVTEERIAALVSSSTSDNSAG